MLYGACASGAGLEPAEVRDSIVALVRANRSLGLKMMSGIFIPDPTAEGSEPLARFQRESASAAVASQLLQAYHATDITDVLRATGWRRAERPGRGRRARVL